MNKAKKIIASILVILTVFAVVTVAFAENVKVGGSVKLSYNYKAYGIDGTFSVNSDKFSISNKQICDYSTDIDSAKSGSAVTTVTAGPSAKVGDSCTVSFKYQYYDTDGNPTKSGTKTWTVKVVDSSTPSSSPTPTSTSPRPSKTARPTVKPTGAPTQSARPTGSEAPIIPSNPSGLDYTPVDKAVAEADALIKSDYTLDSWNAMMDAYGRCQDLKINAVSQKEIDDAAAQLEKKISELVPMDYSQLIAAIDEVSSYGSTNELSKIWSEIAKKLNEAGMLLDSSDQSAVDAKGAELRELLSKLKDAEGKSLQVVETAPTYPFCNIPIHYVWPILFFISLAVNIALIIILILKKKKKEDEKKADDTPMVDYDITDDDK